ncbi:hypothetical protein FKM82_027335 [Ascaphus truei]
MRCVGNKFRLYEKPLNRPDGTRICVAVGHRVCGSAAAGGRGFVLGGRVAVRPPGDADLCSSVTRRFWQCGGATRGSWQCGCGSSGHRVSGSGTAGDA